MTTYFALLHIVAPHLVADERNGDTSSFAAGDMFTKVLTISAMHCAPAFYHVAQPSNAVAGGRHMELAVATGRGHDVLACCWYVNNAGVLQGLMKDNTRQDRYWNQMQRLGGTLSHLLKEVLVRRYCEAPMFVCCSRLGPVAALAVLLRAIASSRSLELPLQVPLSGLDTSPVEIQLVKPLPTQKIGRWKSYHPMSTSLRRPFTATSPASHNRDSCA